MPQNAFTDLWFTPDGDLMVSEDGDLKFNDESSNEYLPLEQFITHRIIGEYNAWPLETRLTAGLDRFIGRIIDDTLLEEIQREVKSALTFDYLLAPSEVTVKVLNLTDSAIAILVYVKQTGDKPIGPFALDIQTGQISQVF